MAFGAELEVGLSQPGTRLFSGQLECTLGRLWAGVLSWLVDRVTCRYPVHHPLSILA